MKNRKNSSNQYKGIQNRQFKEWQEADILKLKKTHRDAVTDLLVTLPSVSGKTFNTTSIKKGFTENGMIDEECNRVPDFYNLICKTTRTDVDQVVTDNIIARFPELMKVQLDNGFVPDPVLESVGITPDYNNRGEKVSRDFAITSENRQRAKTVNHPAQQKERQDIVDALAKKKEGDHSVEMIARKETLKIQLQV